MDSFSPPPTEPTVLDYVKSRLMPWKYARIELPRVEPPAAAETQGSVTGPAREESLTDGSPESPLPEHLPALTDPLVSSGRLPETVTLDAFPAAVAPAAMGTRPAAPVRPAFRMAWPPLRALLALGLALFAQSAFAPPRHTSQTGAILLGLAFLWVAWAYLKDEWPLSDPPAARLYTGGITLRVGGVGFGCILALLAFLSVSHRMFTSFGLLALGLSLAAFFYAFGDWSSFKPRTLLERGKKLISGQWTWTLSAWSLLVLAATLLVIFFRFYRLDSVPPEMVSDHAEKYLDVFDILKGQPYIFFPRNGGREALQFYLLAALHQFLGAGFTFLTLKFSTALVGLLAMPYVYLLGKEIGNRRVALLAFTFAGVGYWTNVVSRAGMRLPFYFLFSAAVLYYLLRGLRRSNRNDFLLAGLALGLSFYGYSADRILPVLVMVAVGLYLVHAQSRGQRRLVIFWTILLALMALVVFLPLLRYITQDPEGFGARMFSRLGSSEQALAAPAGQIFLSNLWNAVRMFSWNAGVVWVTSLPNSPALGVVAGALFYLGLGLVLTRYLRRRHWLDLFLPLSILILMLPSILSLAFPDENPNLYRTGGAMVPVFLLVGLALDGLMRGLQTRLGPWWGRGLAWIVALALLGGSAVQDYNLVFDKYYTQAQLSSWNTSEIGRVIHDFSESIGSPDTAWVMGYPYWVDTRLVALNAGYPERDYALFVEHLKDTQADQRAKLFILNPADQTALQALQQLYPQGWLRTYVSQAETKNFLIYFVPPSLPIPTTPTENNQ